MFDTAFGRLGATMELGSSCAPGLGVVAGSMSSGGLPDEVAGWIAAAPAVLSAARAAHEWDAATRQRVLVALDAVTNAVTVARARVVAAERDAGTWALKGDRDLPAFLGRLTRQGRGAGSAQVDQSATLSSMPAVADALVDGPVTTKHVQEITRATAASPALAAELITAAGQARLLDMARRLDGAHFGTALKQMSATLDPASRQREHDEQRATRYLHITHHPGGTLIRAQLDSVAGYTFGKAIEALNPRPAEDDKRPKAMQRADALEAMAERILTDGATTPGAVAPVNVVVTVSEGTWAAVRAARDGVAAQRAGRAGTGSAAECGPSEGSVTAVAAALRGVPPVVDETGQAWPASAIARALCACELTRAVVDAKSQVLDLGRSKRRFTPAQWLAIYASGQTTCSVGSCAIPLRYTELHHMTWWKRGNGGTDLANCAPACAFHHEEIHRNDIRVTRRPDGSYEHRWPDGRIYGGPPPGEALGSVPLGSVPPGGSSTAGEQVALRTA